MSDPVADARRAKVELAQTDAAFEHVRQEMIDKLLSTPITAADQREKLYLAVQVLDAVRKRMSIVSSSDDIEEFAEEIRARGIAV